MSNARATRRGAPAAKSAHRLRGSRIGAQDVLRQGGHSPPADFQRPFSHVIRQTQQLP